MKSYRRSEGITPFILNFQRFIPKKGRRHPLNKRLDNIQTRSEHSGEENTILDSNPGAYTRSVVSIPPTLPRLQK
jgi:hypothetical protein